MQQQEVPRQGTRECSQWVQKLLEEQGTKDLKPLARILSLPGLCIRVHEHTRVHIVEHRAQHGAVLSPPQP